MAKYKRSSSYTKEELQNAANNALSIATFLSNIDLEAIGGNYYTAKKLLQKFEINCEHWKGKAWNKNEQLKDWQNYTRVNHLKKHLIKLKECKCENCHNSIWLDQPIPLEVHHIDGDRSNNNLNNLQLLCCNCHALTKNWRGRKNCNEKKISNKKYKTKRILKNNCLECDKKCRNKYCNNACYRKKKNICSINMDQLYEVSKNNNRTEAAKILGISRPTLNKYLNKITDNNRACGETGRNASELKSDT